MQDVEVILLLGSKRAKAASLEDEYGELMYGEDIEQALWEVESHTAAEKAYQEVMKAHGFV